ncbi:MAG TPA: CGNR zinc finger domain-containing protein [Streptosporangiaceae bacterium]|nr:CGNR zinc finger domain-containing protein [Streptosporangiaceae bacterium]
MTASPQFAQLGRAVYEAAERAADLLDVLSEDGDVREEVAAVLRAHGESAPIEITPAGLADLRRAAGGLRRVFAAADLGEAADVINELLAGSARPPRLTAHGGRTGWHLHADSSDDAPWGEWFLTSSCLALAVLLTERQLPPAGLCASPSCGRPFVNTGRGSERRYCSATCGTRERVAVHRAVEARRAGEKRGMKK